jgi:hypothetical protein
MQLIPVRDGKGKRLDLFFEKDGIRLSSELIEEAKIVRRDYIFKEAEKRRVKETKKAFGIIAKSYKGWWD